MGGVHSHINHLKGLLTAAQEFGLTENVYHTRIYRQWGL